MYLYTIFFLMKSRGNISIGGFGSLSFQTVSLKKGRSVRHGSVNLKCLQNSPHVFTEGRSDQGVLRNKPVMVLYVLMFNSMESLSHDCLCVCYLTDARCTLIYEILLNNNKYWKLGNIIS